MSDLTSTPTGVDPGAQRPPAGPSTGPQSPAPRPSRPPIKASGGRPVKYPIQMKLNINPAMAASLQRVCQRWGIPEGIGARIALTQFLAQQDPQYRGE
jgi:hypothetical protein